MSCSECKGTGWVQYSSNHSTVCAACCPHTDGWWELTEHHYGYKEDSNNNCCRMGCGALQREIEKMKPGDMVKVNVNRFKDRIGILTNISLISGKAMVKFGDNTMEQTYDIDDVEPCYSNGWPTEGVDMVTVVKNGKEETIKLSPEGGTKHDNGKPQIALIPHEALFSIGAAMTYGAQKYDAHNWRGGFKWLRLASACNRHLWAWIGGEDNDPESGLSHLSHAGACIAMLIGMVESGLGEDNRWKR